MPKADPALAPHAIRTAIAFLGIAAVTSLLAIGEAKATDSERGRLLYENHCTVCHTSVVHVRDQRKATSRDELEAWIRRWQQQLGLQWQNDDVNDVTDYLNDRYYHFKSES